MDVESYTTMMMGVGVARSKYGEERLGKKDFFCVILTFQTEIFLKIAEDSEKKFDFYTDSNVSEVIECNQLLNKIETRVKLLQEQWPENAVLNDVSPRYLDSCWKI